jgi:hypothetical protein
LIDEGADPLQITRRMGHENVQTSFGLHGHLFPDREEDLVAGLTPGKRVKFRYPGDRLARYVGDTSVRVSPCRYWPPTTNVAQIWPKAGEVIELGL